MEKRSIWKHAALAGGAAGLVNGFFGGGGGMVLVPLLMSRCGLERRQAFASSVAIILPLCVLSAAIYYIRGNLDLIQALPYLAGGLAGLFYGYDRIPEEWLQAIQRREWIEELCLRM